MNSECEDKDRNKSLKYARGVHSVQLALPPLACLHLFKRGSVTCYWTAGQAHFQPKVRPSGSETDSRPF